MFGELQNRTCVWSPCTVVCAEELRTQFQQIIRDISAKHCIITEGSPGWRGWKCGGLTQRSNGCHDGNRQCCGRYYVMFGALGLSVMIWSERNDFRPIM